MALTVIAAFENFLSDKVNLDPDQVKTARSSRDWLFTQISSFQNDSNFPRLCSDFNIHYGSFARKTKIRPLDDIDMIIGLNAQGGSYSELNGKILITPYPGTQLSKFCNDDNAYLNSTKLINRFVSKCADVPQYSKAEVKRNGVAAVLSLKSYDWAFDIVPCLFTKPEWTGRTYYLIPDGEGNWKKTDPRIDRERTRSINQSHDGNVLDVLRTIKYWNRRPTIPSLSSYVLETLILDYFEMRGSLDKASRYVDIEMPRVLEYLGSQIYNPVNDPKNIQGDINDLNKDDKSKISSRAIADRETAIEARRLEEKGDQKGAIQKWQEIFGSEFPQYG